jgi:hypothetical protein
MAHIKPPALTQTQVQPLPSEEPNDQEGEECPHLHAIEQTDAKPQQLRRAFWDAAIDIGLAIAGLYFLAFAALAYKYRGTSVDGPTVKALLQAARLVYIS